MNSTLKRRIVEYVQGDGSRPQNPNPWVAGHSLLEAFPQSSEGTLRAAATELHDEGALILKPFNDEPLNFFVKPGSRVEQWKQQVRITKGVAMEVLEFLYEQSEAGKKRRSFWDVTANLNDLSSDKVQDACHWLVERNAVRISGSNGGVVLHIMLLPRGKDIIEGTVEESRVEIHHGDRYHIQDVQNSPIAINSDGAVQTVLAGAEVPYDKVAETIRTALERLPGFELPSLTEKRVRSYLDAAATAVEEDEPDLEHVEILLRKALSSAAIHAVQAAELGQHLAPLTPWFAALSTHPV